VATGIRVLHFRLTRWLHYLHRYSLVLLILSNLIFILNVIIISHHIHLFNPPLLILVYIRLIASLTLPFYLDSFTFQPNNLPELIIGLRRLCLTSSPTRKHLLHTPSNQRLFHFFNLFILYAMCSHFQLLLRSSIIETTTTIFLVYSSYTFLINLQL
jgi:hypothetical protein